MTYKTEQESFWAGDFGNNYIQRNQSCDLLASNLSFFSKALRSVGKLGDCIEFGANIGMNLKALQLLFPHMKMHGVEINKEAATQLGEIIPNENIHHCSIMEYDTNRQFDLVLIKGVLIHISPEQLKSTYERLIKSTRRFLLIAEYYNPTPVTIPYRGHEQRLFKRDFAGEVLDAYPHMRLIDYGFAYHRDESFPQDDITWFLLENTRRVDPEC